ncbi:MAG: hypothetical protein IJT94_11315 [Oscillibacter sp.]|nr:hypothetical protein [Oscillibacter sp.]
MAESAVFFLEEDARPLSLEVVYGQPVLAWTARRLVSDGVKRFFAAAPAGLAAEVRLCFPAGADLTVSDFREDLLSFLDAPGSALVFSRAALPVAEAGPGMIYNAPCAVLKEAWRDRLSNAVQDAVPVSGWIPVYTRELLRELEPRFRPDLL